MLSLLALPAALLLAFVAGRKLLARRACAPATAASMAAFAQARQAAPAPASALAILRAGSPPRARTRCADALHRQRRSIPLLRYADPACALNIDAIQNLEKPTMQNVAMNTISDTQGFNSRRDWRTRSIVQAGIGIGKTEGVGPAAVFLRCKRIPLNIAIRVLFGTRPQTVEFYDVASAPRRQRPIAANYIIDADA